MYQIQKCRIYWHLFQISPTYFDQFDFFSWIQSATGWAVTEGIIVSPGVAVAECAHQKFDVRKISERAPRVNVHSRSAIRHSGSHVCLIGRRVEIKWIINLLSCNRRVARLLGFVASLQRIRLNQLTNEIDRFPCAAKCWKISAYFARWILNEIVTVRSKKMLSKFYNVDSHNNYYYFRSASVRIPRGGTTQNAWDWCVAHLIFSRHHPCLFFATAWYWVIKHHRTLKKRWTEVNSSLLTSPFRSMTKCDRPTGLALNSIRFKFIILSIIHVFPISRACRYICSLVQLESRNRSIKDGLVG